MPDFGSQEWHRAVARLVRGEDPAGYLDALIEVVGRTVAHEGTCLLAFHENAPPEVVHHTLEPAGAEHYLDRYLAGPYLLDPLYQLALRADKPAICRFRDESPDRFRSSEYYRRYRERTHLSDEIDFLVDVGAGSTLALVVGRRRARFRAAEVGRLRLIAPVVGSAMHNVWDQLSAVRRRKGDDGVRHDRFARCFAHFGGSQLTDRERQITQLLLRGHSAKSIARELGIAPGTVIVHKRNLFAKLGITSQNELFSRFIDELSGA